MSLLSLHMGFRQGEILKFKWSDVRGSEITARDTKNGKPRTIHMTETVNKAIEAIPRGKNSDPLFVNPKTQKRFSELPRIFSKTVKTLGLNEDIEDRRQKVVFHTLRHTCASWLVAAGTDIRVVQKVLGHKSLTTTERYEHSKPDYSKVATIMDKVSKVVDSKEIANG